MAERENGGTAEWSSAWNMGAMDGLSSNVKSDNSSSAGTSINSAATPSISSNKVPTKHLLLSPGAAGSAAGSIAAASMQQQLQGPASSSNSSNSNSANTPGHAASSSSPSASSAAAPATTSGPPAPINENDKVYWLIVELLSPQTREAALLELSKKREQWDDLALVLWHSFGGFRLLEVCPTRADFTSIYTYPSYTNCT